MLSSNEGGGDGHDSRQVIPFTKVEAVCLFIKRIESSKYVSVGNLILKFCLLACLFLVVLFFGFFFPPSKQFNTHLCLYLYQFYAFTSNDVIFWSHLPLPFTFQN